MDILTSIAWPSLVLGSGLTALCALASVVLITSRQRLRQAVTDEQLSSAQQQLQQLSDQNAELNRQLLVVGEEVGQLRQLKAQHGELSWQLEHEQRQHESLKHQHGQLQANFQAAQARMEQERVAFEDKLQLLEQAEERLQQQFENLAGRIFEQKSRAFTQTSQASLNALLSPLKEQIDGFKRQITDQHIKEGQERASLKTEIHHLKALNQQITEDAAALTRALKGDSKQQGNWGEVVLERILQESGLRKGHEYDTQTAFKTEDGQRLLPDVIVHLPQARDVIIDSKVSLTAYERYFNASEAGDKAGYLQQHVDSLRQHIKGLSKKDYHKQLGNRTLDYVLMFIPIEPAFLLAMEHEPGLVKLALDNNIMLVSPTNLLVALRTVNNIWQIEYQNQNAQLIAKKAGDLYDKFYGFISDMEKLGDSLQGLERRYQDAMKKLGTGRGNLVRRAEELRGLGVQTSKKLSDARLEQAGVTDSAIPEDADQPG